MKSPTGYLRSGLQPFPSVSQSWYVAPRGFTAATKLATAKPLRRRANPAPPWLKNFGKTVGGTVAAGAAAAVVAQTVPEKYRAVVHVAAGTATAALFPHSTVAAAASGALLYTPLERLLQTVMRAGNTPIRRSQVPFM